MADIRYIKHRHIDLEKWDRTIDKSYNGLVYGYSFVLDIMSDKKWDALVLGDYEVIFPLVWNSKYGLKYLYQPYLCQQLGLFSANTVTNEMVQEFMEAIPRRFMYWHFHLNSENIYFDPGISFVDRKTYQVRLNKDYTEIYDKYNSDAKKNLAKSTITGFDVQEHIEVNKVIACFLEAYGDYYPKDEKLYTKLRKCLNEAIKRDMGFTRGIYGKDGLLWCAGFFFKAKGLIHYAVAAPTVEGKKHGATHILIDEVFKEFAGQNYTFDFEGSNIESVAYFYSKFGSTPVHYLEIIRNRLPWWCRMLMRN